MITVTAAAARSISAETFDDLLDPGCMVTSIRPDGSLLTVTFSCDLDEPTAAAVRDRMTTRDEADQAARTDLRAKRDAVTGDDPVAQAVHAAINYQLGEAT